MAKEYTVKILGWKKYQNREVKTRSVWFRIQNDFIENPNFSEFTSDERVVWLHALCCASKLNSDSLHVPHQCSHRMLDRCTGIDEKTFHRTFEKLKKLRIVEIRTTRGKYADDTSVNADDTLQDETEQDETEQDETEQDETEQQSSVFDFESLALKYPTNKGRQEGIVRAKETILTEADFDHLSVAVDHYAERCRIEETPDEFKMHFSTFIEKRRPKPYVQPWRDWIGWVRPTVKPTINNAAYRRMEGNQHALNEALKAIGEGDEQAS